MAVIQVIPDGDLALDDGGNFAMVEGSQFVRQLIESRFKFFLGEWFLDEREGVPYYRDILIKNPDVDVVRSVFRRVLTTTPGVLSILRFDLRFEASTRTIYFDFEVQSTDGPIVVTPDDDAFIVRL